MKRITVVTGMFFLTLSLHAQPYLSRVAGFLAGGVNDATEITKAYVAPWANMYATSLSAGWYNTARPHKLGGFDITLTGNTVIAPSAERTFDISKLNLTHTAVHPGSSSLSPTIAGKRTDGPSMDIFSGTDTVANVYKMPKGSGLPFVITPMLQAGVGLIKGTEIMIRYSPPINYGKTGKMDMWGVGLKHSLFQWIPVLNHLPVDMSLMLSYNRFNTGCDISFRPTNFVYDADVPLAFDDQKMQMTLQAGTANLLVSTTLPLVNFYGGVGYAITRADIKLSGTYPVPTLDPATQTMVVHSANLAKDPYNMKLETRSDLRYTLGMRIKFGLLTIHADYTYAYYSIVSTGIGLSFR